MLEHLVTALLGAFVLGLATWHLARVLAGGVIFETPRDWLEARATKPHPVYAGLAAPAQPWYFIHEAVSCRLCLNTQVAYVLTWAALGAALVVGSSQPTAYWALALTVGPLVTAAWAEVVRRVERISTP